MFIFYVNSKYRFIYISLLLRLYQKIKSKSFDWNSSQKFSDNRTYDPSLDAITLIIMFIALNSIKEENVN